MDQRTQTVVLVFFVLSHPSHFHSYAVESPIPAPSPTQIPPKHVAFDPAGLGVYAPPISRPHLHQSRPPFHYPHLPPSIKSTPPTGKLNHGKRLGLLFAGIAAILQLMFVTFLIYKRWQLNKMGRRYRMRVSS